MAARGLHHGGVSVNPCDFAPQHTGAGVFNSFSSVTGFIGVYAAGYILHETESNWSYVFVFTSAQCILGAVVYSLMGTANRIISHFISELSDVFFQRKDLCFSFLGGCFIISFTLRIFSFVAFFKVRL
uniref:MFS domain-containing protein n=1 Tax=Ascaris lumbricoides TaxID=6252 RepID=A0A0M3HKW0_ASCLU